MKKILMIFLLSVILIGCSIANTPTSKTEEFLGKYQMLDDDVNINYYDLSNDINIDGNMQDEYKKIIKDQYQSLSYEVKEEKIDGDKAVVTTSIEVLDYKKIINKYNKNEYDNDKYHKLIINDLKDAKTKVTYTIDFTLTKDDSGKWNMDEISNETKEKLLGIN